MMSARFLEDKSAWRSCGCGVGVCVGCCCMGCRDRLAGWWYEGGCDMAGIEEDRFGGVEAGAELLDAA